MDFVRSNVLFKETGTGDVAVGSIALAGILDLEKAVINLGSETLLEN
jgi:hypothetical protein